MSEILVELNAVTGTGPEGDWALYRDRIVITFRKPIVNLGIFTPPHRGKDAGKLEIPIEDVIDIDFKKEGWVSPGYIRLHVDNDSEFGSVPKDKYHPIEHAQKDPLGLVIVSKNLNETAERFKQEVYKLIGK